jgi:hypothetical protein
MLWQVYLAPQAAAAAFQKQCMHLMCPALAPARAQHVHAARRVPTVSFFFIGLKVLPRWCCLAVQAGCSTSITAA